MAVGADGTFLRADSTQSEGVAWSTIAASTLIGKNITTQTVNGTTTETTLYTVSIPANTIGTTDGFHFKAIISSFNSNATGDSITLRAKYGATTVLTNVIPTSNTDINGSGVWEGYIFANGSTSSQSGFQSIRVASANAASSDTEFVQATGSASEDSTGALDFVVTAQLGGTTQTVATTMIVVTPVIA